jgi:hypothetical protein
MPTAQMILQVAYDESLELHQLQSSVGNTHLRVGDHSQRMNPSVEQSREYVEHDGPEQLSSASSRLHSDFPSLHTTMPYSRTRGVHTLQIHADDHKHTRFDAVAYCSQSLT